jgi:hypothetical protein
VRESQSEGGRSGPGAGDGGVGQGGSGASHWPLVLLTGRQLCAGIASSKTRWWMLRVLNECVNQ